MSNQELIEKIKTASKIYNGLDHGCRCGCKGTCIVEQENPVGFKRRATKMIGALGEALNVEHTSEYINVSLPNNRAFTAHFD